MTAPPTTETPETLERLLTNLAAVRDSLPDPARQRADMLLSGREHVEMLRGEARESYRVAVQSFCWVNDLRDVLIDSGVIHAYDFRGEFKQAPPNEAPPIQTHAEQLNWTLLGRKIGFPIGVPASVLTSSGKWIEYFGGHGFNVLTFKTVRSCRTDAHPQPNWVFLEDADEPLPLSTNPADITVHGDRNTYLRGLRAFSTANSFGVPSPEYEVWKEEVRRSVDLLGEGKLLIVSVTGTADPDDPPDTLLNDFATVAQMAMDAGAPAIELNLSCPNTLDPRTDEDGVKPPLCESVEATLEVVRAVDAQIKGAVPLVAKLSYMPLPELEPLVRALNPHVQAFSGINTFQVRVETPRAKPAFGERKLAGLSGVALRHLALDFVRSLKSLRDRNDDFDYEIIAMGGVMESADVHALMVVGADAVQTATAASANPMLPSELFEPGRRDPAKDVEVVERIRETLYAEDGTFRTPEDLACRLGLDPATVERELNPLGELDLPRRVFELLALNRRTARGAEIDPEVWGDGPSPERLLVLTRNSRLLVDKQREKLVRNSATPEVVADRLGWPVLDVCKAIEDGPLIYHEYAGHTLVPLWQFTDDGRELLPGFAALRHLFARDVVALDAWLFVPSPSLGGKTPRDLLAAGETARVLDSLAAVGAGA